MSLAPSADDSPDKDGSASPPVATLDGAKQRTGLLVYLLIGMYLGLVFTKSEVLSWFRIQEMFRFQAFHMFGIIGSAILVGVLSLWIIRRLEVNTVRGEPIVVPPKDWGESGTRYWLGGTLFGLGWGLAGACPGPILALIGNGVGVIVVTLASAILGTFSYGVLRPHLPH